MQQRFALLVIVQQDLKEEVGHPVGLEQALFLERRGSDEIRVGSCVAPSKSCHKHLSG